MPFSWCLEVHFRRERQIKCFPDLSRGEPWNFQRGVAAPFAVRILSKSGEIRVVFPPLQQQLQWKWTRVEGLFKNYATSRSAMPVPDKILNWTDIYYHTKIMRVGVLIHFRFGYLSLKTTQCFKINQIVSFEFFNFGIFYQFLSY